MSEVRPFITSTVRSQIVLAQTPDLEIFTQTKSDI